MREDEAEGLIVGRRSGCDVAVFETVYVATLEEGRCAAEDEINVPCDVAVFKILSSAIQKNRVLPAEETTVTKYDAITVNANGERLTNRASRIFKGDVLGGEVVSINLR